MSSRHQKKSHATKKRDKKYRPSHGASADGGEIQGAQGAMTGMVRGIRRVAGASSGESRGSLGNALLIAFALGLAVLLAIGLSN